MRFILALIPKKQAMTLYIHAAQMLFSPVHEGYLLSENSLPHITICHFECQHEKEAKTIWEDIEMLNLPSFLPIFTGISFIKGTGLHQAHYWAELSVARDKQIMKVHRLAAKIIQSKGLSCLNDSGDLYRPHLTLARIRFPEIIQKWPETLFSHPPDFQIALAVGDNYGQYLYTLFPSQEED